MKLLRLVDSIIDFIETWFIIFSVVLMLFFSFLQVILRNIFSSGIPGTDELLRHMVFWTGLAGASLLTKEGRHIKIDVLARALPPRIEIFRAVLIDIVCTLVSFILFKTSLQFISIEREFGESATLFIFHVPIWTLQLVIPLTFFMMSFRYILRTIKTIVEYFK